MKDLPKRTLTAAIFAAVMLGGILWSRLSFSILVFIINAGCLYEYLKLIRKFQHYTSLQSSIAFAVTMIFGVLLHAAGIWRSNDAFVFLLALSVLPVILWLFAQEFIFKTETKLKNALLNAGGIVYVSLFLFCFYSFVAPHFTEKPVESAWYPEYASLPFGIVLLIWANDTFAYLVGSLIGKHKIFPPISPKKSWEGFFGGLIFSLITAWILSKYFLRLDLQQWVIVAVIVVVFGTIGDFLESMIKRQAGVKDSGNLLPGHGGFLDRFDALLFCLPFVSMYLLLSS
jgi:phosphatidate cytidylyltransferase